MKARQVNELLLDNLRKLSGHEKRAYLGMSGIGRCAREQYMNIVQPGDGSDRMAYYNMIGYALEYKTVERLGAQRLEGVAVQGDGSIHELTGIEQVTREIVADFDARFRGHTDHELPDGTLIEIKTCTIEAYRKLWQKGRPKYAHFCQVQMYMAHGGYDHAVVIYTPRGIPHREWENGTGLPLPFLCLDVTHDKRKQAELNERAKRVLQAIDDQEPPQCSCGWCEK